VHRERPVEATAELPQPGRMTNDSVPVVLNIQPDPQRLALRFLDNDDQLKNAAGGRRPASCEVSRRSVAALVRPQARTLPGADGEGTPPTVTFEPPREVECSSFGGLFMLAATNVRKTRKQGKPFVCRACRRPAKPPDPGRGSKR
jgi:hypothetical protein